MITGSTEPVGSNDLWDGVIQTSDCIVVTQQGALRITQCYLYLLYDPS